MRHRVPSFSLALFDIVKVIYNFHRHLPSPFTSDKNIMLQYASCALTLQNCILKVDCHILIAENETQ